MKCLSSPISDASPWRLSAVCLHFEGFLTPAPLLFATITRNCGIMVAFTPPLCGIERPKRKHSSMHAIYPNLLYLVSNLVFLHVGQHFISDFLGFFFLKLKFQITKPWSHTWNMTLIIPSEIVFLSEAVELLEKVNSYLQRIVAEPRFHPAHPWPASEVIFFLAGLRIFHETVVLSFLFQIIMNRFNRVILQIGSIM